MIANSRDPNTLISTAAALGCGTGTAQEAATFGDVVVVSVPFGQISHLPVAALHGKIVIDTCNHYPDRDGPIEALQNGVTTTSQMLAAALPGARVVKAFNAILAKDLETAGTAPGTPNRRALPLSRRRSASATRGECTGRSGSASIPSMQARSRRAGASSARNRCTASLTTGRAWSRASRPPGAIWNCRMGRGGIDVAWMNQPSHVCSGKGTTRSACCVT